MKKSSCFRFLLHREPGEVHGLEVSLAGEQRYPWDRSRIWKIRASWDVYTFTTIWSTESRTSSTWHSWTHWTFLTTWYRESRISVTGDSASLESPSSMTLTLTRLCFQIASSSWTPWTCRTTTCKKPATSSIYGCWIASRCWTYLTTGYTPSKWSM